MKAGLLALALVTCACESREEARADDGGTRELGAGRMLARERCGACHAVDKETAVSPHGKAPPFAEIVKQYPPEQLSEALSEGIMVGHEDMPEFQFSDEEVDRLIVYLKSLE